MGGVYCIYQLRQTENKRLGLAFLRGPMRATVGQALDDRIGRLDWMTPSDPIIYGFDFTRVGLLLERNHATATTKQHAFHGAFSRLRV